MDAGEIAREWLAAFNGGDLDRLVRLYHADAEVVERFRMPPLGPRPGEAGIRSLFEDLLHGGDRFKDVHVLADNERAVVLYGDLAGPISGCIYFHVIEGRIKVQRFCE